MIITVLPSKYRCGSNRGITAIEYPGLVVKLNQIINWNLSTFPFKTKENPDDPDVEDREFLGSDPKLVPGSMFIYREGQVIACDSDDRLVLVMSETGPLALQRIYDEEISLEFDLKFNYWGGDVKFEKAERKDIPDTYKSYTVPYYLMMIFKNYFLLGRDYPRKNLCLRCTLDSDNYIMPVTLYMQDWTISYNPSEVFDEQIEDTAKELIAWFYNNFEPIKIEDSKSIEDAGDF